MKAKQELIEKIIFSFAMLVIFISLLASNSVISDFSIYYKASSMIISGDSQHVYDYAYWKSIGLMPYRYFPTFLILISPLTSLSIENAYLIFGIFNLMLMISCALLMKKICALLNHDLSEHAFLRISLEIAFYVFLPYQAINIGQTTMILALILLSSIYYFLIGNYKAGCFLLGFTFVIKPVFFLLAFIVLIRLRKERLKGFLFLLLPLIPDAAIFILNPPIARAFIQLNLDGFVMNEERFASVSFVNIFYMTGLGSTYLQFISIAACAIFILIMTKRRSEMIVVFILGITSYLVTTPEAWPNQLFFVYAFLFIAITRFLKEDKRFLIVFFIYTFVVFIKLSIPIGVNLPDNFETSSWHSVMQFMITSPMLILKFILTILIGLGSLYIFIQVAMSIRSENNGKRIHTR